MIGSRRGDNGRSETLFAGRSSLLLLTVGVVLLIGASRNFTLIDNGDVTGLLQAKAVQFQQQKEVAPWSISQSSDGFPKAGILPNIQVDCRRGDRDCNQRQQPDFRVDGPSIRRERGLPPKILFHHAHKTGGTSACTMAIKNGEITPSNEAAKHLLLSDGPVCYYQQVPYCQKDLNGLATINTTVTYVDFHCSAQSNWQQQTVVRADTEKTTTGVSASRSRLDWMLVTFLRHPLERLLSEYQHYGVDRVFVHETYKSNMTTEEKRNDRDLFLKYARDRSRVNFYRRFYLPHCGLGKNYVQCAKETLQGYDVVVILEDFVEDCPRLADALGWNSNWTCSTHRNANKNGTTDALDFLGEDKAQELLQLNSLDVDIYNFARFLAEKQRQRWRGTMIDGT